MTHSFTKTTLYLFVAALTFQSFMACKTDNKEEVPPGIDTSLMDTSVKPNDDFFRFVNGTWYDNTEIPDDRSSWGVFAELRKNTDYDVLSILEEEVKKQSYETLKDAEGNPTISDQQKAVYFYEAMMNVEKRDELGIDPIKPLLDKIDAITSIKDLEKLMIESAPYGGVGFFDFSVFNDLKNSTINAGYLVTSGLGLSRDYYVDEDEDTAGKREKYMVLISKMLQHFGTDEATANENAKRIFDYEHKLALPRLTKEERRDARNLYNPMTLEELTKITPSINWEAYFSGIGINNLEKIIVMQPKYMEAVENILTTSDINDLKLYLKWTAINDSASILSQELDKTNWEFYGKTLRGSKEQRPLNERALSRLNRNIGEALGKLYVEKKFPPEAKAKAEEMISNIKISFGKRIKNLPWMSEATKEKALEKLNKMTVKIAYPDKWKDYKDLDINSIKDGGSLFNNYKNINKWNFQEQLDKLGKPVDRTEWGMAPQVVNAYFNPVNNEIVFPAAILQPPFYNYHADAAVNYGGIGAVIGHEISHSFDDSGSRFDADGNLSNWWTDEDLEQFKAIGKKLANQFNEQEVLEGVNINGEFTLGENIGDLAGLNAAFDGLQIYMEENGTPDLIDEFTPEQRFFMSWATVWRSKAREDALRNQIKTDPHSPGKFRAFMPLRNIDAFYEAFDIIEGNKMYLNPEDRIKIW